MCRRMPLLLMMGLLVAAVVIVHHLRQHRTQLTARVVEASDRPDAAIALRTLTHSPTPEKSWVTEGDQSNAETRLLVGRTRKPGVTEDEALRDARHDVESRVRAVVADAMHPSRLDAEFLAQRISKDVSAGRFEVDRLAEKFERPYGRVWTEAVLVDLSPDKLKPAIDRYRDDLRAHRKHLRTHWAGFIAITLMVLMGYALSNMITRGYFTGRLRMMALLVVALGAVALI